MIDISNTFHEEASKVNDILNVFNESIESVVENTGRIKSKTQYVTDELQVNSGKIDHIGLKIHAYKALIFQTTTEIENENSCRFSKWFTEAKSTFLKGNSTLGSIGNHHSNIHKGLTEAISLNNDAKYTEALARIKDVENSSESGFNDLFNAVKSSQK